jgi:hypothetical protein
MYIIAGIRERELHYIAGDVVPFRAGIDNQFSYWSSWEVVHLVSARWASGWVMVVLLN